MTTWQRCQGCSDYKPPLQRYQCSAAAAERIGRQTQNMPFKDLSCPAYRACMYALAIRELYKKTIVLSSSPEPREHKLSQQ